MKKLLLLLVFMAGFSTFSYSQRGSEKSGGFFSRIFSKGGGKRSQIWHFDKRKKDPNIKHNGTSYKRGRRSGNKVDGNGYSMPDPGRRKKSKKNGIY